MVKVNLFETRMIGTWKYFVYDEEGNLMRSFQTKGEAERYLQDGWTIKFRQLVKRDGYSEALFLGEALV